MGYAATHDVPAVDETVTIDGREVMHVKTLRALAGCGSASIYRAIDSGALTLVYRGLVDARTARAWAAKWTPERSPLRARKRPQTSR
jgi:hypothetical protein